MKTKRRLLPLPTPQVPDGVCLSRPLTGTTNTIKLPEHMSTVKYAPTRKGGAMAMGRGIHFSIFSGERSLMRFTRTANPKNR
ncbi:hypothetical protein CRG98_003804 [Punica granatum]|uniref:Uncharacterized protein n=1 Tax=Punica granatum TaxID=22663 RepID=A0A2I0L4X6_PUNGR|nr:hypothetical protein CRG98_003804 [Punica granatum]